MNAEKQAAETQPATHPIDVLIIEEDASFTETLQAGFLKRTDIGRQLRETGARRGCCWPARSIPGVVLLDFRADRDEWALRQSLVW
jgi:hypothetical protein